MTHSQKRRLQRKNGVRIGSSTRRLAHVLYGALWGKFGDSLFFDRDIASSSSPIFASSSRLVGIPNPHASGTVKGRGKPPLLRASAARRYASASRKYSKDVEADCFPNTQA